MEERTLHVVIVGHVDHGKSTLIGRLFYDTGCLPAGKLEEIKRISEEQGKELEFAYMMDHLEEERNRGITIDIAHTFFKTDKRRYVIIDAPGHKEFLKNMISGSSQAEAALLLVDVAQGIKDQTKRHCYILSMLGIKKQVIVLINKMDLVNHSQEQFNKIKTDIEAELKSLGIVPTYVLPISARDGDNVAKKSNNYSWFSGPTVLEALDTFETLKIEDKDLRFPVQDVYDVDGQSLAVGRIEAGTLRGGDEVFVLPEMKKTKVLQIKKFGEDNIAQMSAGECVGVAVEGEKLHRGQVVADKATAIITDTIHANIFWMIDQEYEIGIPLVWRCATQAAKAKIEKIYKRFDAASVSVVEKDATKIGVAEVAEVLIKLDRPVVVDKFSDIPELGRFVLENAGHPLAGGIII